MIRCKLSIQVSCIARWFPATARPSCFRNYGPNSERRSRAYYFAPGRSAKYFGKRACLVALSKTPCPNLTKFSVHAILWPRVSNLMTINAIRYVLPVLWITWFLPGPYGAWLIGRIFKATHHGTEPGVKCGVYDCRAKGLRREALELSTTATGISKYDLDRLLTRAQPLGSGESGPPNLDGPPQLS